MLKISAVAALLSFCHCNLYLVQAASGQMEILWNRVPVSEALLDPRLSAREKESLLFFEEVRSFALRNDFRAEGMFQKYTRIDRDAAAYNVTAAPALSLEPLTWWFPIVGTVPYLGFFQRERAEEEARKLTEAGFDTRVGAVAAYSTLGWFDDPVLSTQLDCSQLCLSRLFLHEATHATVWIPGSVSFNESLASFVEEAAARQFWLEKQGVVSPEVARMDGAAREMEKLTGLMQGCAIQLQDLYKKYDSANGPLRETALLEKKSSIEQCKSRLKKETFRHLNLERWLSDDWNNTHFLAYLRYHSGTEVFRTRFLACESRFSCFFEEMRSRPPELQ